MISWQQIGHIEKELVQLALLTNLYVLVQSCCRIWEYELKTRKCLLLGTVREKMEQEENEDTVIGPMKCEGGNIVQCMYPRRPSRVHIVIDHS